MTILSFICPIHGKSITALRFSDLFNLPVAALWTVVLGENNRKVETGYEQRIPVDKIIMHEKYRHFKNDLGSYDESLMCVQCLIKHNLIHFLM